MRFLRRTSRDVCGGASSLTKNTRHDMLALLTTGTVAGTVAGAVYLVPQLRKGEGTALQTTRVLYTTWYVGKSTTVVVFLPSVLVY